jgi:HD superfamily phosphohydrolase
MEGKLDTAISIFTDKHPKRFLHQLVSSQLDVDRLDYLNRDSFYTGVTEGTVGSDRIIKMMDVVDDELVLEEKGIYSIEKFLLARRLMYWQAYLHKTSLVAELMLTKVLKRAKELTLKGEILVCSNPLQFFLLNKVEFNEFDSKVLAQFAALDDFDVISAIKGWQSHSDFILSHLSTMIINRDLLKIRLSNEKVSKTEVQEYQTQVMQTYGLTAAEANYFVYKGKIKNQAYNKEGEPIRILKKDKTIEDVVETSDQFNSKALVQMVTKYYVCFPKVLAEK